MKIIFVLRNGFTFGVTCEEFSLNKNGLGQYTGYEIKGIKDNKPLYISWEDVVLVYTVIEAEGRETDAQIQRTTSRH